MGTIADKLTYLSTTKELIKQAIISKGQAISSGDTFRDYATKIDNISGAAILISKNITADGTYYPADDGAAGYNEVTVSVPREPVADVLLGNYNAAGNITANLISHIRQYGAQSTDITAMTANSVVTIGASAFEGCRYLSSVSFPLCETIQTCAFRSANGLSEVLFPECKTIESSAFAHCSNLVSVSFPKCSEIPLTGFFSCVKLTNVLFPSCTTVSSSAFQYCYELTDASFPECTVVRENAFGYCSKLRNVSLPECSAIAAYAFRYATSKGSGATIFAPKCETIGMWAFAFCYKLQSFSSPALKTIASSGFYENSILSQIYAPELTGVGSVAFGNCVALSEAIFSKCTSMGASAFVGCTNLQKVVMQPTAIGGSTFRNCTKLESLYLIRPTVTTLTANAFANTPMSVSSYLGHFGSIYVPSDLYSNYLTAANWSLYSARIVSITQEEIEALF